MSEPSSSDSASLSDLQNLVIDNPDLEKLESMLGHFNIFEALGAVRQELRHSDFLAYLLNPRQNHGMGDLFVKRLLQKAIAQAEAPLPVTPIDLHLWDLDDLEVRREWQSIDILLLYDAQKVAVIIENKLYSGEHSDQLNRYWQAVRQDFPGYRIIGIFLTPEGGEPTFNSYIPISYELVCSLIEDLCQSRASLLGQEVLTMMTHYTQMLRRHIVGESEIEQLCIQIYRRHQKALDLIFEHRPDRQLILKEYLCELIASNPYWVLDHASKTNILFLPKKWDLAQLNQGQGWTKSGRMFMLQFFNIDEKLILYIVLGPGPEPTRRLVFDWVSTHEPPFKRAFKALGRDWSTVYKRTILSKSAYEENDLDGLKKEIQRKWDEFLTHEFPKIDAAFEELDWAKIEN